MSSRINYTGYFLLFLLFPLLFLFFCSINIAGGFETTNGIRISVCANHLIGKTTPGAQIIFCDTSFISPDLSRDGFLDTVYADLDGNFKLCSLQDGCYNLVARNSDFEKGAVITNINIDKSSFLERTEYAEYLNLGSISGAVINDSAADQPCLVYIKGLAIFDSTVTGYYRLSLVPPGNYRIHAFQKKKKTFITNTYYASRDNILLTESGNQTGVDLYLKLVE